MLKDTRFILVRTECPYIQSAAIAHVINTERFVVGGTNDRERDRSQVSDGMVERVAESLGRCSIVCEVLCVFNLCLKSHYFLFLSLSRETHPNPSREGGSQGLRCREL